MPAFASMNPRTRPRVRSLSCFFFATSGVPPNSKMALSTVSIALSDHPERPKTGIPSKDRVIVHSCDHLGSAHVWAGGVCAQPVCTYAGGHWLEASSDWWTKHLIFLAKKTTFLLICGDLWGTRFWPITCRKPKRSGVFEAPRSPHPRTDGNQVKMVVLRPPPRPSLK